LKNTIKIDSIHHWDTQFDTQGLNNIAKWDGSSWSAMGSGITHTDPAETAVVYDILIKGGVVAGGLFEFLDAGTNTAKNVARWNGTGWYRMGDGIAGHPANPANFETYVLCLESDWTDIYAGGLPKIHKLDYSSGFLYAGGEFSEDNVKKGDEPWVYYDHPPPIFGNGVNGTVYDLVAKPGEVWVGGDFSTAGGNPSHYIGRYVFGTFPNMTLIRVPTDYLTIQEAIDVATYGDTIQVAPGTYNISSQIYNDHVNNLLILGSRQEDGSNASVINAQTGAGTYQCVRFAGVNNCTIAGFEIMNGSDGIVFDNCADCLCTGNYIHDIDAATNDGAAIGIWNSNNMQVVDCIIDDNEFCGITVWQSNNVLIDHNTILRSQLDDGIDISGTTDHLTITSNILAFHNKEGIDTNGLTFTDFTHNYNCFWQNGTGNISGMTIGANSFDSNPLLVDINNQNYYLQSGSPCLGAGEYGSDVGALGVYSDVSDETGKPVKAFMLAQNYPNPFNPSTTISYSLPKTDHVRLSIYNLRGEKITTLLNGQTSAGHYKVTWDGKDTAGNRVSSGIYLYRLEAGSFVQTRKMLFVQ